jgi:hypothetical protein
MSELNQQQQDYIKQQVDAASRGKYTFAVAKAVNADKGLAVAGLFPNGSWHTASVDVGDDSNWLSNEEQFRNVVAKVVKALGRP